MLVDEIADVKKKYPELSTVQSFSQEAVDSFDSDTYDNFVRKTNAFEVAKKLDLKPLSVTTGLTYDTASPSLKSLRYYFYMIEVDAHLKSLKS